MENSRKMLSKPVLDLQIWRNSGTKVVKLYDCSPNCHYTLSPFMTLNGHFHFDISVNSVSGLTVRRIMSQY